MGRRHGPLDRFRCPVCGGRLRRVMRSGFDDPALSVWRCDRCSMETFR